MAALVKIGAGRISKIAADLFDGEARLVKRGEDFTCQRNAFINKVRLAAKKKGGRMVGTFYYTDENGEQKRCTDDEWVCYYVAAEAPQDTTQHTDISADIMGALMGPVEAVAVAEPVVTGKKGRK